MRRERRMVSLWKRLRDEVAAGGEVVVDVVEGEEDGDGVLLQVVEAVVVEG
jgi:hypothetical protein